MRNRAEAIVAPVLPAETIAEALPVANKLGGAHERRIFLRAHRLRGVLIHADDFGTGKDGETLGIANEFGWSDQDDIETEFVDGATGARDDFVWCVISAQRVESDGQGQLT